MNQQQPLLKILTTSSNNTTTATTTTRDTTSNTNSKNHHHTKRNSSAASPSNNCISPSSPLLLEKWTDIPTVLTPIQLADISESIEKLESQFHHKVNHNINDSRHSNPFLIINNSKQAPESTTTSSSESSLLQNTTKINKNEKNSSTCSYHLINDTTLTSSSTGSHPNTKKSQNNPHLRYRLVHLRKTLTDLELQYTSSVTNSHKLNYEIKLSTSKLQEMEKQRQSLQERQELLKHELETVSKAVDELKLSSLNNKINQRNHSSSSSFLIVSFLGTVRYLFLVSFIYFSIFL